MRFMEKELYVFLYGKKEALNVIEKRLKKKKLLSLFIPMAGFTYFLPSIGILEAFFFMALLGLGVWVFPELLIRQKCKEIRVGFKLDIPDFLDRVALLLEAGQPVWYAVRKAVSEDKSELSGRIALSFEAESGMEDGRNPEILLARLAEELKVPEFSSVVSVIVQNSRKGEKELASVLRLQSNISRQERKYIAGELGNKASNLLLIPSSLVFIAVLIILIAPAIMELGF